MIRTETQRFEARRQSVRKWSAQKLAQGKCGDCGYLPLHTKRRCKPCNDRHTEGQRARRRTPEERKKHCAREKVRRAVKRGRLVRPSTCPRCGSTNPIHAHHKDYSRYLDVDWMCDQCHFKEHRLA